MSTTREELGHVLLPKTLGDKRNFVLTLEELKSAEKLIAGEQYMLTTRLTDVRRTIRALETGRSPVWEQRNPVCFTLAHTLEWMVDTAKYKLAATQWSVAMLAARRNTLAPGPKQQGDPNEQDKGAA